VIPPDGRRSRASISTPDELRTGPGVTASSLIAGSLPANRAAISNTETGPAASSNWKFLKISTPIIFVLCPEMREIWHFGLKGIMRGSSRQAKSGGRHVRSPANRNRVVSPRDPA
jgi:hypothetical protein